MLTIGADQRETPSYPPLFLTIYGRQKSCPWDCESGRTGHICHQLQHLREPHLGSRVELDLVSGVVCELDLGASKLEIQWADQLSYILGPDSGL